ncbi:MAG: hypothetical protein ACREI7_08385, partial [Myxococcota bacterium]
MSAGAGRRLSTIAAEIGPTAALAAGSLASFFAEAPSDAGAPREGPGHDPTASPTRGSGFDTVLSSAVASDPSELARELAMSAIASTATWQIEGVSALLTVLRDVPGRKLLLFYSQGVTSALVRDQSSNDRARFLAELQRTFAAARRGGWSAHPIDLTGIPVSGTPASTPLSDTPASVRVAPTAADLQLATRSSAAFDADALFALADATGGVMHENFNDFAEAADRVLAETDVSYLLTFQRPQTEADGKLHKIEIRLIGAPARARAVYRDGNQARLPEGERSAAERRLDRAAELLGDKEIADLDVDTGAFARPAADGRWSVAVEFALPRLPEPEGAEPREKVVLELAGYAIDDDLAVAGSFSNQLKLDPVKLQGRELRAVGEI